MNGTSAEHPARLRLHGLEFVDERFANSVFPMGEFAATFAGSTIAVRTKARGTVLEIAGRPGAVVFAGRWGTDLLRIESPVPATGYGPQFEHLGMTPFDIRRGRIQ